MGIELTGDATLDLTSLKAATPPLGSCSELPRLFNRTAAEAGGGEALLLYTDRISHLFSRTRCPPLPSSHPRVLSGTGPPSSEWNEDGLRSKPFPPAWPLHTATLCRQQNHLLQGIECVLRYYLSMMIKYEMKISSTFRLDEAHLQCSEISIKIFSYDGNFMTLVFNNGSKTILFFYDSRCLMPIWTTTQNFEFPFYCWFQTFPFSGTTLIQVSSRISIQSVPMRFLHTCQFGKW